MDKIQQELRLHNKSALFLTLQPILDSSQLNELEIGPNRCSISGTV